MTQAEIDAAFDAQLKELDRLDELLKPLNAQRAEVLAAMQALVRQRYPTDK